jgi:hypothetical protein
MLALGRLAGAILHILKASLRWVLADYWCSDASYETEGLIDRICGGQSMLD